MFPDTFDQLAQAIAPPPAARAAVAPPAPTRKKKTAEQELEATIGPAPAQAQANGPGYGEPIPIPSLNQAPADPGGFPTSGFAAGNPGFLPPPGLGMGPTLAKQMMERPTAQDKQEEMRQVMTRMPRGSQATPMPGMLGMAGMNQFTPESDADYHARGLKAFEGLDRMAGGAEKLALEKYLGVGALGNDTTRTGVQQGQLEIGQRGQAEKEREGEHLRNRNTEKMKLYQAKILAGATPEEAMQAAQGMDVLGAQPGFEPAGFSVSPGNPTAGRPPAGQGPPVPGQSPRVDASRLPPDARIQPPGVSDLLKHTNALGTNATSIGGAMKKDNKTLPEIAVALHAALGGDQGFSQKLPAVKDYLQHLFKGPQEWDYFVNPTLGRQFARRANNLVSRPSPEEVLMSQIRNQLQKGPAYGQAGDNVLGGPKPGQGFWPWSY